MGQGGMDWGDASEDLLGLDVSANVGSLQPFELDPLVNFAVGPRTQDDQTTNILGYIWGTSFSVPTGIRDKAPWVYGSPGHILVIDGDTDRPTYVSSVQHYTFDLSLPVPLNRIVFFPPERGRTPPAGPLPQAQQGRCSGPERRRAAAPARHVTRPTPVSYPCIVT